MLISPTEPARLKEIGEVSGAPERYGCDILITTGNMLTGVQRKKFPEDLVASLADGRLTEQLRQMEHLDRRLLILEGYGKWTMDGELIAMTRFTKAQMFGLVWSIAFEFGVEVIRVADITETILAVESLERWAGKEKHISLVQRPGPKKDGWGRVGAEAWGIHLLQGFPGIGPELAGRIIDHFGGVPLLWKIADPKDLQAVPGIGKVKAENLWKALNEEKEE